MLINAGWVLTAAGSLLTVAGSAGIGICICTEQRMRAQELAGFEKFLMLAAGEVSYGKTKLPSLFCEVGQRMNDEMGDTLCRIGERMEDGSGDSLEGIWKDEMSVFLQGKHLKKEERSLLFSFPGEIGFLDGKRQQSALEEMRMEIGRRVQFLGQQQKNREKVTMALCLSGGIAAAILFL